MSSIFPPITVTDHPKYGTFHGEVILGPDDWPWWLVGRFDENGVKQDVVTVHVSYITRKKG
jgi:hypothetical protein